MRLINLHKGKDIEKHLKYAKELTLFQPTNIYLMEEMVLLHGKRGDI